VPSADVFPCLPLFEAFYLSLELLIFQQYVSFRHGYFIDAQSLGPLSLVMAPSTPFYKIFGTCFFWFSLQGIYDAGFISFLCISLYLPSICAILLSISVSLPRALGCLVYWSTDHFMILGFSNTRRSSGLHGRQDLYNHYEPSSISVSSASRPWLPGLLVNWPFYDSHFPQRSLPVGASRTWSLGPRQLIRTFRNLLLFPSLCLAPSVAWFIGHLTIL